MIQFVLKEFTLMLAFIVLGGLLLLSFWITRNVDQSIFKEFRNGKVSVILRDGAESSFRKLLNQDGNVVRYEVHSAASNKDRLGALYPELQSVISPLAHKFFPVSASVTVVDPDLFLGALRAVPDVFEKHIVHRAPHELRQFLTILTVVLSILWALTLTLIIYFNLERLTQKEERKWSLMKMLGAKASNLFAPLWAGQAVRVVLSSLMAILIAKIASAQIEMFFAWEWVPLSPLWWASFFLLSVCLTSVISFGLFALRYRQVTLG